MLNWLYHTKCSQKYHQKTTKKQKYRTFTCMLSQFQIWIQICFFVRQPEQHLRQLSQRYFTVNTANKKRKKTKSSKLYIILKITWVHHVFTPFTSSLKHSHSVSGVSLLLTLLATIYCVDADTLLMQFELGIERSGLELGAEGCVRVAQDSRGSSLYQGWARPRSKSEQCMAFGDTASIFHIQPPENHFGHGFWIKEFWTASICLFAVPGSRRSGGVQGHAHLRGSGEAAENGRCDLHPPCSLVGLPVATLPLLWLYLLTASCISTLLFACTYANKHYHLFMLLLSFLSLSIFLLFSQWWCWVLCFKAKSFNCEKGSQINLPPPLAFHHRPCACQLEEKGCPKQFQLV